MTTTECKICSCTMKLLLVRVSIGRNKPYIIWEREPKDADGGGEEEEVPVDFGLGL